MILLTIAIPTFNRKESLQNLIKSLIKEKNQSFNILVSDNNSKDGTEDMVKKFMTHHKNISYSKNKTNIGYSGNILRLYKLTKTKYIWFLSDDEILVPEALEKILISINKYKPSVALFNHLRIDPYGRKMMDGVKKDHIYEDARLLKNYSPIIRACFMSIVVLEKRLSYTQVRRTYEKNNVYFQLTLVVLMLKDKPRLLEVATPAVIRNTTFESGEFFKFILTDFLDAIFAARSNFDEDKFLNWAVSQIPSALQLYLSQKIGLYKYNGLPSLETMKKIFKYYRSYSLIIALFPIIYLLVPKKILKYAYLAKLKRIHSDKKAHEIYEANLNRIMKTNAHSGFTRYR